MTLQDLMRDQSVQATAERTSVDVCVCTYGRRPIESALRSIADQSGRPDWDLRVVVADNSETPDARADILALGAQLGLDLAYLHAPARNISVARNACLSAATAEWIAFLDDDEQASPQWLEELVAEARSGGWQAVLGPVEPVYAAEVPSWVVAGRFHTARPVWVKGAIETGYTGNALLKRSFLETCGLRFDPALGRSGGEDLDFFYRLRDAGGRIGFADRALVLEPTPPERTTLVWLLRRNFRAGQSHGAQLAKAGRAGCAANALLALFKCAACLVLCLANAPSAARRNRQLFRAALHAGVVARLAGVREIALY